MALEDWVLQGGGERPAPTLILRHDVDQHPGSALAMAEIEHERGLRSTWYFRWRTAHSVVIRSLRDSGYSVGLHYETLSRRVLARGIGPDNDLDRLVEECRPVLRREIAAFVERFGQIQSVCPHGDSRVPYAANARLLKGEDFQAYGILFDGNQAMHGRGLAHWLTDRSLAEGGWKDLVDPAELFGRRVSPILGVVHPNNWVSGPGLWKDRALARVLPNPGLRPPLRPIRTGTDEPPL